MAVTLLPMAVWGQTDDDLPYVDVKKDAAGKYGYYYENGDCLLPPLFDWALQFGLGDRATAVKYMALYYVIDREGYLILPTGFEDMPDVYKNFAVVGEEGKRYAIDLQGRRLSPEGWSVEPLERSHADPLFFAMTPVGDETGGAALCADPPVFCGRDPLGPRDSTAGRLTGGRPPARMGGKEGPRICARSTRSASALFWPGCGRSGA